MEQKEPSRLLSGKDFLSCVRGRHRAGCDVPETTNYILQQCPRTHQARKTRHNHIANYATKKMRERCFEVHPESKITVATKAQQTVMVDGQILVRSTEHTTRRNPCTMEKPSVKDLVNQMSSRPPLQSTGGESGAKLLKRRPNIP